MSFSNNVVPTAGRNLIAAAAAADQIVMVEFVASETAYTALQLESATPSDFEITGGFIRNVAVSGDKARITGSMQNQAAVKNAKSFAILARLQSESVGDEVVLVAASDSSANIRIPSTAEPPVLISLPLTITTAESGTVYVAAGSVPSMSDLDNFVTLHDPVDPSEGQEQSIKGDKHFIDDLYADNMFYCDSDAYFQGYTEMASSYADELGCKEIYGSWQKKAPDEQLSIHGQGSHDGLIGARIYFYTSTDSNGNDYNYLKFKCSSNGSAQYPEITFSPQYKYGGGNTIPSKIEISNLDEIVPEVGNSVDLGASGLKFKDAYAYRFNGDLVGRIPRPTYTSGTTQDFPIGAIFLEYKTYTGVVEVGDTWTISTPSTDDRVAKSLGSTWSHTSKQVGAGTYMALSESDPMPNGGAAVLLVMRIS